MRFTNICFDLDGTLTDPKVGITKSVQYALRDLEFEVENLDQLEPFIGPPLAESFQQFYGLSDEEIQRAIASYRVYFKERGMLENEIYPGIRELLLELKERGCQLYVATSKPTVFAVPILKHFQIDDMFQLIAGSELDGTRSAKAEVIQYVLDAYEDIDPATVVMIGDRKHDLIGAQHTGVASIGVGYGYGSEEELRAAHPTYYAETVQELRNLLLGL